MKTERILGALYGQALGDAMGCPPSFGRAVTSKHTLLIDRFLPGPKG